MADLDLSIICPLCGDALFIFESDKNNFIYATTNECNHKFHSPCLKGYANLNLKNNQPLKCPMENCQKLYTEIQTINNYNGEIIVNKKFEITNNSAMIGTESESSTSSTTTTTTTTTILEETISPNNECPICTCDFQTQQQVAQPSTCEHEYCVDCLSDWCKRECTCPMDRRHFEIINIFNRSNNNVDDEKKKRFLIKRKRLNISTSSWEESSIFSEEESEEESSSSSEFHRSVDSTNKRSRVLNNDIPSTSREIPIDCREYSMKPKVAKRINKTKPLLLHVQKDSNKQTSSLITTLDFPSTSTAVPQRNNSQFNIYGGSLNHSQVKSYFYSEIARKLPNRTFHRKQLRQLKKILIEKFVRKSKVVSKKRLNKYCSHLMDAIREAGDCDNQ